ncbi:MAG: hypothetical protein EPO68_13605 [Planctomycetota bacterium]|nr:MAG: hypothetical protein EPO68_13605 [Planctomycetota bacterium]
MRSQFLRPRSSLLLAALAAAAVQTSAQDVTLRGKVEDVQGTANQFFVDCTKVQLTSGALDLNAFVGQQVSLQGNWNGSTAAPSIAVTSLEPVAATFEIGGGAKLGGTVNFHVFGTPGDIAVPALAVGSGFVPVGAAGSILIELQGAFVFAAKVIPAVGPTQLPLAIPSDPALVGVDLFGQAGVYSPGSGALLFSNPDCKTIDA